LTLPPLSQKRTRVALLASSYLDAVESAAADGARGDKPSSRLLLHDEILWPRGSYDHFEKAVDSLRVWAERTWLPAFWHIYVENGTRLIRGPRGTITGYQGHPVTRHIPIRKDKHGRVQHKARTETTRTVFNVTLADAMKAEEALSVIVRAMRSSPCFVPAAISENAGYDSSQAKAYQPDWANREAA
jgi:hypothetical protein